MLSGEASSTFFVPSFSSLVWPAKCSTPLKASTLTIYWSSYDKHEVMKRTRITLRTGKFNKTFLYQEIWYKMIACDYWILTTSLTPQTCHPNTFLKCQSSRHLLQARGFHWYICYIRPDFSPIKSDSKWHSWKIADKTNNDLSLYEGSNGFSCDQCLN